eukprot:m.450378 g.450378  ORF g.450378 m.450378 type:complete len:417 (+) comp19985_c0_seq1:199-1449(+)
MAVVWRIVISLNLLLQCKLASTQATCVQSTCASVTCSLLCAAPCGWVSNTQPQHCACGAHTDPTTELLPGGLGPDGGPCPQFAPTTAAPTATPPNCTAIICGRDCAGQCGWSTNQNRCVLGGTTTSAEQSAGQCTDAPSTGAPSPHPTLSPSTVTSTTNTVTTTTATTPGAVSSTSPEPETLPAAGSVINCPQCEAGTSGQCAYAMPNGATLCFPLSTVSATPTVSDCPPAAAHITVSLCTAATTTTASSTAITLPSCSNCTFGTTGECREDTTGVCTPYKDPETQVCYDNFRSCATLSVGPTNGDCFHCSAGTSGPCQTRGSNATNPLPCFPRSADGRCQSPLEACSVFQAAPQVVTCPNCNAGAGECLLALDNGLRVCYARSHCDFGSAVREGFQICTETINNASSSVSFPFRL